MIDDFYLLVYLVSTNLGSKNQYIEHLPYDGELNDFIRQNVESAYHPCGTCRMGDKNDPEAVVDNKCKVIGIDNLRVADSSIFPQITNGNINAPSIMIGEKVSDYILNNTPPPLIEEEYWKSPNWQTSDR